MSEPDAPPEGVAALADRPVDGARVARVMAGIGALAVLACLGGVEHLLASANEEPAAAARLRAEAQEPPPARSPPAHVALLLIDGLRVDEASRLASWSGARASRGTLRLPTPTLSRPFYHLAFTGVPPALSGVRSNRFAGRARFETVQDRVRNAGGSVRFVGDGLDWMRRMHGRPGDGGSDAADALTDLPLHLARFLEAPAPSLLVVHTLGVDRSAHAGDEGAHEVALREADVALATLLESPATIFAMSDHGHVRGGGHGGGEPIVARAPLLVRDPDAAPRALGVVHAERIAASVAAALGVARPRHAVAPALDRPVEDDPAMDLASGFASLASRETREQLAQVRRVAFPLALVLLVMTLGPIKRAFGFDRSVPIAILLWPLLVVAGHLAWGRPLSLSAVDDSLVHAARIAVLGAVAAGLSFFVARRAARAGTALDIARRIAASIGWVALGCALLSAAASGFALGPWPLTPRGHYLPLLAAGAAAPALALAALALWGSTRAQSTR